MTATWRGKRINGGVWSTRNVSEDATRISHRFEVIDGAIVVAETRFLPALSARRQGLTSVAIHTAVAMRGAVEAAEPLLDLGAGPAWQASLTAVRIDQTVSRDREAVLTAIGYVAALDSGSQRPIPDLAKVLDFKERRVRGNIQRARDRAFLSRGEQSEPRRGAWRGIRGGVLTPLGDEEFARLLRARLSVHENGTVHSSVSSEPGTAARLLEFLAQEPAPGPLHDSLSVRIGPAGAVVHDPWGPTRYTSTGVAYRRIQR